MIYDNIKRTLLHAPLIVKSSFAAEKLAGRPCVTLSVDDLYFEDKVHVGEIISLVSGVNRAFNTSMEVGIWKCNFIHGNIPT